MKQSRISLWEKFKRVIAHAFEMETKLEQEERKQEMLRREHDLHIAKLYEENLAGITAWNEERAKLKKELAELEKQRKLDEQRKKEQEERVRLHKDNIRMQKRVLYHESTPDIVDVAMEEVSVSEETIEE